MNYTILSSGSRARLIENVREMMQQGYTPVGGVAVETEIAKKGEYYERTVHTYIQAMVKLVK